MHKEKGFGLGELEVSTGQDARETHGEGKCVATWPVAEPGPPQGLPGAGEDYRTDLCVCLFNQRE